MTIIERDTVLVVGPDAEKYLQGQLSNDVVRLGDGESAWTFLLEPSGKLGWLERVLRRGPEEFVLDLEPGTATAVEARLRRFLIRTKVTITTGTELVDIDDGPDGDLIGWWGEGRHSIVAVGVPDPLAADALRVAAGWPGADELVEGVIPGETGCVVVAASFTKGCYTGQELVARIDSRGNHVPRLLRRVELADPSTPGRDLLDDDGVAVGTITSRAGSLALAYVARRIEVPATLMLEGGPVRLLPQRED